MIYNNERLRSEERRKERMSIEEYRALIEPYLDSKGYEIGKRTRTNARSYIKKLVDFMQEKNYSEISNQVISEYIKSYEGKSQLVARKRHSEEFAEYVKGERQASMIEEKESKADIAGKNGATNGLEQTETDTGMNEPVQGKSSFDMKNEPERTTTLGRPKKPAKDRRENSFCVYLNAKNAEALKDLAFSERKEVSVFLAEIIENFISRNEQSLIDYRIYQKDKKPLQYQ